MILECFMGVLWIFDGLSWGFVGFCGGSYGTLEGFTCLYRVFRGLHKVPMAFSKFRTWFHMGSLNSSMYLKKPGDTYAA